jgi:hypothetical protein
MKMAEKNGVEKQTDRKLVIWFLVALFIALIPWWVLA